MLYYFIVPTSFLCLEVVGPRKTLNLNLVLITKYLPKIVSIYSTDDYNIHIMMLYEQLGITNW